MIQPVSAPNSSPPGCRASQPLGGVVAAIFGGPPDELYAAARSAFRAAAPSAVLDAALEAWIERRGRGGTTGTNAILALLAARDLGCVRGGQDAEAAAVVALGFLQHAAARRPGRRSLPGSGAFESWTGWGDEALLHGALSAWRGGFGAAPDEGLLILASRHLVLRPSLRAVRGLLLASRSSGGSEAARQRVQAFLLERGPSLPARPAAPPPISDEALEAAIRRACRLDPRPSLGHALQLTAACVGRADLSTEGSEWTRAALLAAAPTWLGLQRHWQAFLRSSHG